MRSKLGYRHEPQILRRAFLALSKPLVRARQRKMNGRALKTWSRNLCLGTVRFETRECMHHWDSKLREVYSGTLKLNGLSLNPASITCSLGWLSFPLCISVYSFQVVSVSGTKLCAYRLGVCLHGSMLADVIRT